MFNFFLKKNMIRFSHDKSLAENLHIMSPILKIKTNAKPIQNLLGILAVCELNVTKQSPATLSRQQCRKDVLVLKLAKLAIDDCCEKNKHDKKTVTALRRYYHEVHQLQTQLIQIDNSLFLNFPYGKNKCWLNPLHDEHLSSYLSEEQQYLLATIPAYPRAIQQQRFYSLAIFIPLFNLFLDGDFMMNACNMVFI